MDIDSGFKPEGFSYLRDNEPLSAEEITITEKVRKWFQEVFEKRNRLITEAGQEIWKPAKIWDLGQPFYQDSRMLLEGRNIRLLRLYSKQFTGYPLYSLGGLLDIREPMPSAEEQDRLFERYENYSDGYIPQYAGIAEQLPDYLHISPPKKLGEVGWFWKNRIITHDTRAYLERIALLYRAGFLDKTGSRSLFSRKGLRILEIGGGYGGLAYYLKSILKDCRYVIVDIPESLIYSAIYLSVLHPSSENFLGLDPALRNISGNPGFTFIPNYEFSALADCGEAFDLCINTLSMSEMSEEQVRSYCEGIKRLIGEDGCFFEQNQDNRIHGFGCACEIAKEYFPYRKAVNCDLLSVTQGLPNIWSNQTDFLLRSRQVPFSNL